jgi:hypothetical protein
MSSVIVTHDIFIKKNTPVVDDDKVIMGKVLSLFQLHVLKPCGEDQDTADWTDGLVDASFFIDRRDMPLEVLATATMLHYMLDFGSMNEDSSFAPLIIPNVPEGSVIVSFLDKRTKLPSLEDSMPGPEFYKVPLGKNQPPRTSDETERTFIAVFPSMEAAISVLDENNEEKNDDGTYKQAKLIPWDAFGVAHSSATEEPLTFQLPWGCQPSIDTDMSE